MLSVTDLTGYNYCQRKLYLAKVLKLKEPLSKPALLGSLKHKVFEHVHNSESRIIKSLETIPSKKEILNLFKLTHSSILRSILHEEVERLSFFSVSPDQTFTEIWNILKDETFFQANRVFSKIQETNLVGKPLLEILEPKVETELYLKSEDLQLKGKIDKVEIYKDQYLPVEIKTGQMPRQGAWPDHIIQAAAYCLLLEKEYSTTVNNAQIIYYNPRTIHNIALNPFMRDQIFDLINKVNTLLKQKNPPDFCSSPNKCNICGLKDQCYGLNVS